MGMKLVSGEPGNGNETSLRFLMEPMRVCEVI